MSKQLRIGVDTGGTFTDICLYDPDSRRVSVWKLSSTNADPSEAIAEGIRGALEAFAYQPEDIAYVGHGTTVATNALIEGRVAKTALVTTAGFRDVVEIGRQMRPALYDLQTRRTAALASRDLRLEVTERVRFDGSVLIELDDDEVRRIAARLREEGVQAVAVCLLFAHLAPAHEQRIKQILQEQLPGVFVSCSHEVAPEYREYERFSTALVNTALGPVMQAYLDRLQPRLTGLGIEHSPRLTQSNGGVISARQAALFPVRTVLSGPAAGVMGAVEIARAAGIGDVITFDMGGTSSDVCLITDGQPPLATSAMVHGHPLKVPMLDIHAVGAGGGSLAQIDVGGLLKVGPGSAGAYPGPVCYGNGNLQPTVTDANVVLQVLNPTHLLGGRMAIDQQKARDAIGALASQLGLGLMETAQGIISIVTANMAKAIRVISIERGHDPRNYVLMAFGGAGPVHAARLARELEIRRVLIPRNPGILCAMGLLLSDPKAHFSTGCMTVLEPGQAATIEAGFARLDEQALDWFEQEGIAAGQRHFKRFVDLRYQGQAHELLVPCPQGAVDNAWIGSVLESFRSIHRHVYGFDSPNEPVRIIAIRLEATGSVAKVELQQLAQARQPLSEAQVSKREVWLPEVGIFVTAPVYDREQLGPGHVISGPAIIEQMDSTTLVLPGQDATVDAYQNILIEEHA